MPNSNNQLKLSSGRCCFLFFRLLSWRDLRFLTRSGTCAPCSGSADCQGILGPLFHWAFSLKTPLTTALALARVPAQGGVALLWTLPWAPLSHVCFDFITTQQIFTENQILCWAPGTQRLRRYRVGSSLGGLPGGGGPGEEKRWGWMYRQSHGETARADFGFCLIS